MPRTHMLLDKSDALHEEVIAAMAEHHPELWSAKVTLTMIRSSGPRDQNGDVCGPAVTVGGYPAMASIKITNLKQRAAGLGDAVLDIDGNRIDELSAKERNALFDHELTHLALVIGKEAEVVRDDLGRPKLKARKHDQQYGWFNDVAERHGENAFEVKQLKAATSYACENGWLPGFSGG